VPPTIIIIKPNITEEERQKGIDRINDVLTEIAHENCKSKV